MDLIAVIGIAFGLAMDAFAVSVTSGIVIKNFKIEHAVKIGLFFGLFQAIMPVMGWLAGFSLKRFIYGIDHWIVFGILSFIGIKMIYESFKMKPDDTRSDPLNIFVLLVLAVATSIDALAVGISFVFLNISIVAPVIVIGAITFGLSIFGVFIGNKIGHFFENKVEVAGGLILIGIGIKI